jgi:hypothetical protein
VARLGLPGWLGGLGGLGGLGLLGVETDAAWAGAGRAATLGGGATASAALVPERRPESASAPGHAERRARGDPEDEALAPDDGRGHGARLASGRAERRPVHGTIEDLRRAASRDLQRQRRADA